MIKDTLRLYIPRSSTARYRGIQIEAVCWCVICDDKSGDKFGCSSIEDLKWNSSTDIIKYYVVIREDDPDLQIATCLSMKKCYARNLVYFLLSIYL